MTSVDNALEKIRAKQFIEITKGMKPLMEIDLELVSKVFDHCICHNTGDTEYHFLDGTTIAISINTKGSRFKRRSARIVKNKK